MVLDNSIILAVDPAVSRFLTNGLTVVTRAKELTNSLRLVEQLQEQLGFLIAAVVLIALGIAILVSSGLAYYRYNTKVKQIQQ